MALTGGKVYKFKRTVDLGNITASAAGDVLGALKFTLADLPNYTEFTALYDQYKIYFVVLRFVPDQNMASANNAAGTTTPILYHVIDYDDATAPANKTDLFQYQNLKVRNFSRFSKITLRPHVAVAAYQGAFTGYANFKSLWLDAANTAVEHYGVKYCISQPSANWVTSWRLVATYYMAFKNVR